eukprot:gene8522-210_t
MGVLAAGCPQWPMDSTAITVVTTASDPSYAIFHLAQSSISKPIPATIRYPYGAGFVVLQLLTAGSVLRRVAGQRVLSLISFDVVPFEVSPQSVQLMMNRSPTAWNVTLVNNDGVTKQPDTQASVDHSKGTNCTVSLKPDYGTITSAVDVDTDGHLLVTNSTSIMVYIEPGQAVTISLTVRT